MKAAFDHETLDVYQASLRFVCWVDELLLEIPKTLALHNPFDRASTSPRDMDLPGLRLHELKGKRKGTWAVNVSGNRRITFRFDGVDAIDVDYEDKGVEMMEEMGKNLISLAISIFVAFLVIRHFQGRQYPRSLKYSTFWPRFWSPTIDGIVLWPVTVLIPFLVQSTILKTQTTSWGMICFTSVIHFAYIIHFNARYGGTIGKLKCNLRIVDHKSEGPISYRQAIIRDAIPMVLVLVFCAYSARVPAGSAEARQALYIPLIFLGWFLVEVLTMLTNSKRRALHDYIAGTVVMRTNVG